MIAAIADGASAISNLYFTGKGAQNVEQTSMSVANAKRYQAILDRRMKIQDKWNDSRLAASIKDAEMNNRWIQAALERKHKEELLKAKTDADVANINTKYANDFALLETKNKATAEEGKKNRAHAEKIASNRNTATIKAAGIRSGKSGDTDKEFTNISDGKGGNIRVRIKDLSPENTGKVYADMVRENPEFAVRVQSENIAGPMFDDKGNPVMVDVSNPTESQMRVAIGKSIGSSDAVQRSYKEISGYGNSNGGTSKKKIKGF